MTPDDLLPTAQDVAAAALAQGRLVLISLPRTGPCRFLGPDFQRVGSRDALRAIIRRETEGGRDG